jgi:hypothetical protein
MADYGLAQVTTIIDFRVPMQRAPRKEMIRGGAADLLSKLTQYALIMDSSARHEAAFLPRSMRNVAPRSPGLP